MVFSIVVNSAFTILFKLFATPLAPTTTTTFPALADVANIRLFGNKQLDFGGCLLFDFCFDNKGLYVDPVSAQVWTAPIFLKKGGCNNPPLVL